MKKPKVQQKTERRISAALRLVLVAVLLLLTQIALVLVLNDLLRQRMAIAYTLLELVAWPTSFASTAAPAAARTSWAGPC